MAHRLLRALPACILLALTIAATPASAQSWIAIRDASSIIIIDSATGDELARFPFVLPSNESSARSNVRMGATEDGLHLYVQTTIDRANTWVDSALYVIDVTTGRLLNRVEIAGTAGRSVVVAPDASRAYSIKAYGSGCCGGIVTTDLVTGAVQPAVFTDHSYYASLAMHPDGSRLFRFRIYVESHAGYHLYIGAADGIRFTPAGLTADWTRGLGMAEHLVMSPDGAHLFVTLPQSPGGQVTIIDSTTVASVAFPMSALPCCQHLEEVGPVLPSTRMVVTTSDSGTAHTFLIDITTGAVLTTLPGEHYVGDHVLLLDPPTNEMFDFDATHIWRVDNDTLEPKTTVATGAGWLSAAVISRPCPASATVSPAAFTAAASTGTLTISASPACAWTIDTSGVTGMSIGTLSGTGNATLPFSLGGVNAAVTETLRVGLRPVRINRTQPVMAIEAPAGGGVAQPFTLRGYAIVLSANASTAISPAPTVSAVHVWAWPLLGGAPLFVGAAPAAEPRSDIAAIYGPGYASAGFSVPVHGLPTGLYAIVAYAQCARSGIFTQQAGVLVSVLPGTPVAIDSPASTAPRNFVVSGWAIDPSATTGTGVDAVHVWAYPAAGGAPVWVGAADYGGARPDVGAAVGSQFTNSGYWLFASLAPGDYTLVVFARSIATGEFTSQTRPLTITGDSAVEMNLDAPAAANPPQIFFKSFTMLGWAIDRGAASGTGIDAFHVWAFPIDGSAPIFRGTASTWARSDVAALFGPQFLNSGFLVNVALPAGTYDVAVFAHSSVTHDFSTWRVVRVTVATPF